MPTFPFIFTWNIVPHPISLPIFIRLVGPPSKYIKLAKRSPLSWTAISVLSAHSNINAAVLVLQPEPPPWFPFVSPSVIVREAMYPCGAANLPKFNLPQHVMSPDTEVTAAETVPLVASISPPKTAAFVSVWRYRGHLLFAVVAHDSVSIPPDKKYIRLSFMCIMPER